MDTGTLQKEMGTNPILLGLYQQRFIELPGNECNIHNIIYIRSKKYIKQPHPCRRNLKLWQMMPVTIL